MLIISIPVALLALKIGSQNKGRLMVGNTLTIFLGENVIKNL
jgi:hypothetical protein